MAEHGPAHTGRRGQRRAQQGRKGGSFTGTGQLAKKEGQGRTATAGRGAEKGDGMHEAPALFRGIKDTKKGGNNAPRPVQGRRGLTNTRTLLPPMYSTAQRVHLSRIAGRKKDRSFHRVGHGKGVGYALHCLGKFSLPQTAGERQGPQFFPLAGREQVTPPGGGTELFAGHHAELAIMAGGQGHNTEKLAAVIKPS